MRCEGLDGVGIFAVVVGEKEVTDPIIESVIETSDWNVFMSVKKGAVGAD